MRLRPSFVAVGAGAATSVLFSIRLTWWLETNAVVALGFLAVVSLPTFRGAARDVAAIARLAAIFFGLACAIALPVAAAEIATGEGHTFATTLSVALPMAPLAWLAWAALLVVTFVLALDGAHAPRADGRAVSITLVGLLVLSLVARLAWIASMTTLPIELYWFDAPFLVNALKLDAHVPLYGPMADLNSFTYSPLADLLHHALLRPLALELSLLANHVLMLLDQLVAAAVLLWAVWPYARADRSPWGRVFWIVAIALAVFANLVAPAVHPDHPLLVCMAIAFALLLAEDRWPPWAWWTALVLVTPIATAFKLSGEGIAVGLALVFAHERRGRALAVVMVSALLGVATIPLFEAFLGDYATYAITMHTGQDVEWGRLARLAFSPYVLGLGCAIVFAWRADASRTNRNVLVRIGALTLGIMLVTLRGYARPTARDNNLAPLLVCAVLLVLVALGERDRGEGAPRFSHALHPALPVALVLLLTASVRPPAWPLVGAARDAIAHDSAIVTSAIREDTAAHRRTLALLHAHDWIAAGRRDVPVDRYASALELLLAHRPEAFELPRHVEDGRYDTVIVAGRQLSAYSDPRGELSARILRALAARYEIVYPLGVRDVTSVEGPVIFHRVK